MRINSNHLWLELYFSQICISSYVEFDRVKVINIHLQIFRVLKFTLTNKSVYILFIRPHALLQCKYQISIIKVGWI